MTAECLGVVDTGTIKIGVAGPRPKDAQQANVPYAKNALELFKQDLAGKLGRKLRVEIGEVALKVDFVYKEYGSVSEASAQLPGLRQQAGVDGFLAGALLTASSGD